MKFLPCRLSVLIAATLIAPNAGAAPDWQFTEAATVSLPPSVTYGVVCSSYDSSVCANVSDFYRFNHQYLQRFTIVGTFSKYWGLRASLTTGAQAAKLSLDPRLLIGLIGMKPLSGGRTLSAEVFGSIGGDLRHKPCLDEYDREYFCGSLTAWSDYPTKRISFQEYGIKVLYKF